jgi:hypothetical protein
MTTVPRWDENMTYATGNVVLHGGRAWVAVRWSCGTAPGGPDADGFGPAWVSTTVQAPAAPMSKADMAASRDARIGKGA